MMFAVFKDFDAKVLSSNSSSPLRGPLESIQQTINVALPNLNYLDLQL